MSILNSNAINKIKDAVVSGFNEGETAYGKNLFNRKTVLMNTAIREGGKIEATTNYYLSNFIKVKAGESIKIKAVNDIASVFSAFYDSNRQLIESSLLPNSDLVAQDNVREVPINAVYFRFSVPEGKYLPTKLDTMQVEYGEVSTSYEAFKAFKPDTQPNFKNPQEVIVTNASIDVKSTSNPFSLKVLPYGKNMFNKNTIIEDMTLRSNGVLQSSEGWFVSDFIPVLAGRKIKLTHLVYSVSAGGAFYDINKNFIQDSFKTNAEITAQDNVMIVPSDAVFFRFTNSPTHPLSQLNVIQLEYGDVSTTYEEFKAILPKTPNLENPQEVIVIPQVNVIDGYKMVSDKHRYQVMKYDSGNKIVALHKDWAVALSSDKKTLFISQTGIKGDFNLSVEFNSTNFPNLRSGSTILRVLLIPYSRDMSTIQPGKHTRIVVTTNLGQIYHNLPARATTGEGNYQVGDYTKFDESVIWDMKGRKYPSTDPSAAGVEKYTPGLPQENYEYSPAILRDNGFGNGGFPKQITHGSDTYARFYEPQKNQYHSFDFMAGYEPTSKLTLLGTYRPNGGDGTASRICVFATSDGGRSWYCKFEFASEENAPNRGVAIDTRASRFDDKSVGDFTDYTADSFVIKSLKLTFPTAENKEPSTIFTVGEPIVVSNISKSKPAEITTKTPHGLPTNALIVVQNNDLSVNESPSWDWLRNDTLSASSGGNGRLFKVLKISETKISLHEYIHNPFTNLPTRHIHSINNVQDGFTIGCGEFHPQGWMFYVPTHASDEWTILPAWGNLQFVRLTSTKDSLQRALGFLMLDDIDSTVIYGSDEAYIDRPNLPLPEGRTDVVNRNSIGVFKGKLADIDDVSKFECILKTEEPVYFLKEKIGALIFSAQRGDAGVSFDYGETWERDNWGDRMIHFGGISGNAILSDDLILFLK